ncbi:hypothetical protein P154DRAFT_125218 [Amniculicola lignicola CBS 123094]|uniref:Uncharacterized protein n=1 Tax=Amniculicola lignicola CBS 123094 TaxID=1392246 RepID=A0A6A5WME5_9PLEO|nr:hypothetical protein P154DRAFT_125218 [Amniculicola lignicola CBS 123094]
MMDWRERNASGVAPHGTAHTSQCSRSARCQIDTVHVAAHCCPLLPVPRRPPSAGPALAQCLQTCCTASSAPLASVMAAQARLQRHAGPTQQQSGTLCKAKHGRGNHPSLPDGASRGPKIVHHSMHAGWRRHHVVICQPGLRLLAGSLHQSGDCLLIMDAESAGHHGKAP